MNRNILILNRTRLQSGSQACRENPPWRGCQKLGRVARGRDGRSECARGLQPALAAAPTTSKVAGDAVPRDSAERSHCRAEPSQARRPGRHGAPECARGRAAHVNSSRGARRRDSRPVRLAPPPVRSTNRRPPRRDQAREDHAPAASDIYTGPRTPSCKSLGAPGAHPRMQSAMFLAVQHDCGGSMDKSAGNSPKGEEKREKMKRTL